MVRMVDIGHKEAVPRMARASGLIRLKAETLKKIEAREVPKGDVLAVAQTAAIMAVKRTTELIPLTHPIPITGVDVDLKIEENGVRAEVEVRSLGKTGVEMEALAGVIGALLSVWDMVKGLEKDEAGQYQTTCLEDIRVVKKVKGWVSKSTGKKRRKSSG
ncbi:MAG: cyclic pyranopterin monophosphate synthase MoaC [Candidatus Hadarchaeum sp.]|uniref:cyclic pyranopterin monophosphate synthase MoaC n=1 Tax=Candidatus Hadarchaeum sp. TaxID=2883567 RepID=UPI003D124173